MYTLDRVGKYWHCYFIARDGSRFRRSTKRADKREARHVADAWYLRHADPTYQAAHHTTVGDGIQQLKLAKVDAQKSAGTMHFYQVKTDHLARVLGEGRKLATIDAKVVDAFIATRKQEGAKANTISKELTALRQMLKHARRRGEFDKELSQVMPVQFATGYVPRTRKLTIDDAWRLIHQLPEGVGRYVAYTLATTSRDTGALRARGRDIGPLGIRVDDRKTKRSVRTVPFTPVTEPFARHAFDGVGDDEPVASGVSSARHAMQRACDGLGMPRVSSNDLRRSVAHWFRKEQIPLPLIAEFFGHGDTRMLEKVYGKLDADELRKSLEGSWKKPSKIVDPEDSMEASDLTDPLEFPVPRDGIEPPTRGFSIPCSTN